MAASLFGRGSAAMISANDVTGSETSDVARFLRTLVGICLLALGYAVAGWVGLLLAVPPGYASVVWPASGLAVGALILYGNRLWPGVTLGAFIINAVQGGGAVIDGQVQAGPAMIALGIAVGSTIQMVAAASIAVRLFGRPLQFRRARDVIAFIVLISPVVCVIAPTVGVLVLWSASLIPNEAILGNWVTWWAGDSLGVLIFLPIVIFNPWRPWEVQWHGLKLAGFTGATLVAIALPIGATFYVWKAMSEAAYNETEVAFTTLADVSNRALDYRMSSYLQSLDGGAGLFSASDEVTANDWIIYTDVLDLEHSLPGISGIGFIEPVNRGNEADLVRRYTDLGVVGLEIKPESNADDRFVITLIEPLAPNLAALGLDIGFETHRRAAAEHARDTGHPTITHRILLVQDETSSPGFLMLRPLYRAGSDPQTIAERRAAHLGWVYAPFIANRLMADLTISQGKQLNISVFDGEVPSDDTLIYSSAPTDGQTDPPAFRVAKTIPMMEQRWTIVWESTPAFEAMTASSGETLILVFGVTISALLSALLLSYARREEAITRLVEHKTLTITAQDQQNRSIMNSAVAGIVLTDAQGKVLSLNKAAETALGHRLGQGETLFIGDRIEGIDAATLHRLSEGVETSPETPSQLFTAFRPDGTQRALDLQVNRWTTEDQLLRYTAVIRDVTEERRISNALRDAEARWNSALESGKIAVYDIDLISGKSVVSDTWKSLLQFSPDEDIDPQVEFLARIHPDDLGKVLAADAAVIEQRSERSTTEFRFRAADDKMLWLRSDGFVAERATDGTALRLLGTMVDITSAKVAADALNASERKFRAAIENAPVGTALVDGTGAVITANEAICRFFGLEQTDFLGHEFRNLFQLTGSEWDALLDDVPEDQSQLLHQGECAFTHADGHQIWGILNISHTHGPIEQQRHLIVQIMDITDRKQVEQMKQDFVATISHELRTPLTSIRGALGLVTGTMSKDMSAAALTLLTIANRNCDSLSVLVNDFLDIEKMASNSFSFHMKVESVVSLVREAIETNEAYAGQFGVRLTLLPFDGNPFAKLDKARFQQVLSNLLSNAAKFSPHGDSVAISITTTGTGVRVAVADNGPGIAPSFQRKIFQRFAQEDSSATRQKGGTGLGLHVAKQMMEGMGGTLDFSSKPGDGSTFWIEIPLATDKPDRP
ncbi:CHASE domain-containing protein [Rhodobacteraceae bacterium KMM 6894]|nr:CHASE domain-containing protein [Rhodobacteraceae bacterium KMM 6894]